MSNKDLYWPNETRVDWEAEMKRFEHVQPVRNFAWFIVSFLGAAVICSCIALML
jgi:hypothetical protein